MLQNLLLKDRKKKKCKNRRNKQRKYYSGKKKRHTIKTQIVIKKSNRQIICTNFTEGKTHDFKLFKESNLPFQKNQTILIDTGYVRITKYHENSEIPKKRSKNNPLTKEDKLKNRKISSLRVSIENVIGAIKKFSILSDKYRNRRKRFGLRFNLIAGIYNYEI